MVQSRRQLQRNIRLSGNRAGGLGSRGKGKGKGSQVILDKWDRIQQNGSL